MLILVVCWSIFSINLTSATKYTCDPKLTCGCTAASTSVAARIVGGELAANHAWGWMVSLRRSSSHICGASLLTSQYAITAGHCVKNDVNNPTSLSIVVGTNYLNDVSSRTYQRRTVTKIILHPNYNVGGIIHDIAILQFAPLSTSGNSSLRFICLPNSNQDPFQAKTNLVAIGWGYTFEGSGSVSNSLRQVTIQSYSSASIDCLQSGLKNSNAQFCAGNIAGGKDTCQGDSGGPLMAFVNNRWVLAGITSVGPGCARAGYLGIYTRVSSYIPFITTTVKSTGVASFNFNNAFSSSSVGFSLDIFVHIFVCCFIFCKAIL